jgi:hypothetical protein
MDSMYDFETINGNRSPRTIYRDLLAKIERLIK